MLGKLEKVDLKTIWEVGKSQIISKLKSEEKLVAMVGDGIKENPFCFWL